MSEILDHIFPGISFGDNKNYHPKHPHPSVNMIVFDIIGLCHKAKINITTTVS